MFITEDDWFSFQRNGGWGRELLAGVRRLLEMNYEKLFVEYYTAFPGAGYCAQADMRIALIKRLIASYDPPAVNIHQPDKR